MAARAHKNVHLIRRLRLLELAEQLRRVPGFCPSLLHQICRGEFFANSCLNHAAVVQTDLLRLPFAANGQLLPYCRQKGQHGPLWPSQQILLHHLRQGHGLLLGLSQGAKPSFSIEISRHFWERSQVSIAYLQMQFVQFCIAALNFHFSFSSG